MATAEGNQGEADATANLGSVRADIWVWSVRKYKTRSAAAKACKAGHVKINGKSAKASSPVRLGDQVVVRIGGFDHILQVKQLLERRVSYPLARLAYEDLTPERLPKLYLPSLPRREAGSGRPTKKERRQLDRLRGLSPNQGRR
ncbi:MAG: RNA-binding S4 domain-containing protein [Varibaculum cambriense]|nr:RNA-binding S4 domain-containing protein [Varibaculum cambriense]MDU5308037.1 RNA-binding S4 domain-containing protein [Varibaculum cambriense]